MKIPLGLRKVRQIYTHHVRSINRLKRQEEEAKNKPTLIAKRLEDAKRRREEKNRKRIV